MKFMCSKCGKIFDGKNSYADCSKHEELCGCDENQKMKIVSITVSRDYELKIVEDTINKDNARSYSLGMIHFDINPLRHLTYNPEKMTLNDALKEICKTLTSDVEDRKRQFKKQMDNYRKIIALAEHTDEETTK